MQKDITDLDAPAKAVRDELKRRLEFHNVFREVDLVARMTPRLEVEIAWLAKMDILTSRTHQEIIAMLTTLPFARLLPEAEGRPARVRLEYGFSPDVLVVTGILEESLSQLVAAYECSLKRQKRTEICKAVPVRKLAHNGFFTLLEAGSRESAENLKGFLRNRKKQIEDHRTSEFKIENRRIRIFSLGEENLFAFIVDVMTEYKAEKFYKDIDAELLLTRRPPIPAGALTYHMFGTLQSTIRREQHEARPAREAQGRRGKEDSKEEDVSSDSTCFTSECLEKLDSVEEEGFKAGEIYFLDGREG